MKKPMIRYLGMGGALLILGLGTAWALGITALSREGQTPQSRAGEALAVDDVTDDGIPDLLVGAPRYEAGDPPGENQNTYVSGEQSDGQPGDVLIYKGTGAALEEMPFITLKGNQPSDRFGATVVVGDVTNDGINDVIVAAIRASGPHAPRSGCVYIFSGTDIAAGGNFDTGTAVSSLCGHQYNELFGRSLAVGQFDGEGGLDLAIGAPWHSPFQPGLDKAEAAHKYLAGAVYMVSGVEIAAQMADVTHKINASITPGDGGNAGYGQYILNLGDLDVSSAGKDELLIFSTGAGGHGHRAPGQAYLVTWDADDKFGAPLVVLNGTGQLARYKPAILDDINGDGVNEIGVSSSTGRGTPSGADTNSAGGIYVLDGDLLKYMAYTGEEESTNDLGDVALGAVTGAEARDFFGVSISGAGDVNGDGVKDFAVGAPWTNGHVTSAIGGTSINDISGSVYFISGKSILDAVGDEKFKFKIRGTGPQDFLLAEIAGMSNDRFGEVLAQGDLTAVAVSDLVVGAPDHDPLTESDAMDVPGMYSNDNRGAAFILSPMAP